LIEEEIEMGFFRFDNGFHNELENTLWVIILIAFRCGDYCTIYNSPCYRGRKGSLRQGLDKTRGLVEPCLKAENAILTDAAKKDIMIYK
jgi:hypothetical protein